MYTCAQHVLHHDAKSAQKCLGVLLVEDEQRDDAAKLPGTNTSFRPWPPLAAGSWCELMHM